MQTLIIINDAPYGSERPYQALRLADALLKIEDDLDLTIYLVSDGVWCAKKGQKTPDGYYNVERMLKPVLKKAQLRSCKTCMEARGIEDEDVLEGVIRSTLGELATLVLEADKVLNY